MNMRAVLLPNVKSGLDTDSFEVALKNTLRQAPDVILIGEIRSRENHGLCHCLCRNGAFGICHPARQQR